MERENFKNEPVQMKFTVSQKNLKINKYSEISFHDTWV